MTAPFRTSRRVEFADTDLAGIAHFSAFFRWMEAAEVDFLVARGLSVKLVWQGEALGFPRVAASCDYLKPVTFLDVLDIDVRVERIGKRSVTYAFSFFKDGVEAARGKVTSCCCRVAPGGKIEAVDIPEGIREKIET